MFTFPSVLLCQSQTFYLKVLWSFPTAMELPNWWMKVLRPHLLSLPQSVWWLSSSDIIYGVHFKYLCDDPQHM